MTSDKDSSISPLSCSFSDISYVFYDESSQKEYEENAKKCAISSNRQKFLEENGINEEMAKKDKDYKEILNSCFDIKFVEEFVKNFTAENNNFNIQDENLNQDNFNLKNKNYFDIKLVKWPWSGYMKNSSLIEENDETIKKE